MYKVCTYKRERIFSEATEQQTNYEGCIYPTGVSSTFGYFHRYVESIILDILDKTLFLCQRCVKKFGLR